MYKENQFTWTGYYMEFADKLLGFRNRRAELLTILEIAHKQVGLKNPFTEKGEPLTDICPFTVFGAFNKGITDGNRSALSSALAVSLNIQARVPTEFSGIPVLNNMQSWFFWGTGDRGENDIDTLWETFESAIKYADDPNQENRRKFISCHNKVIQQNGVKWNITLGFYWIRPFFYINLDSRNRSFLLESEVTHAMEILQISDLKQLPKGKWEHPGIAVAKSLTEITMYTDYVQRLETLVTGDDDDIDDDVNIYVSKEEYLPYSEVDFLADVFMEPEQYETVISLLKNKMNLILQGAPGVGKTYAAKRLAYSIIGEKDTSRVMMIQFHQSYSYEDFIMGFRPTETGFKLEQGPFYAFCKKAQDDIERDYFFIIDEINRGNLSKIFGELLMLIENDKRGEKLRLLYSNELFSVPKNVFLIGLMNTADRSLALIDYALRRRFAFYEMEPGFDSSGFQDIFNNADNEKFGNLIECIKGLNTVIENDESLGGGFRIGHSYFCTKDEITDYWLEFVIKHEILPLLMV